jgi:hypothetical protein
MPWKGAKRMTGREVRRVAGRSLPVVHISTQWTIAIGEGDEEGRNITYITMGTSQR